MLYSQLGYPTLASEYIGIAFENIKQKTEWYESLNDDMLSRSYIEYIRSLYQLNQIIGLAISSEIVMDDMVYEDFINSVRTGICRIKSIGAPASQYSATLEKILSGYIVAGY